MRTVRSRRVVRWGLLTTAGVLAGFTPSVVQQAGAVISPAPTPWYSWAAKVYTPYGGCSGELIAQQWLVTAAHCFQDHSGAAMASGTSVVLPAGTFSVDDVETTTWEVGIGTNDVEPDLAVLHLMSAPSGATPLPIATLHQENSFRKKGVTFFGFGQGETAPLSATLGKTPDYMWTLNANCPAQYAEWNVDCFTHHSSTKGIVTHGDSGGAWVGWSNGQWVLLATDTGPGGVYITQYGTSVVRWLWWINKMEAQYVSKTTGTPPTQTTATTSPPPAMSISIGWGSVTAPAGDWMDITFTNFPTGTVSWYCVEEGTNYGPYSTTLTTSPETLTSHTCYDTESGGSDYVTADGITSNTILTDASAPPPPTTATTSPPPAMSISIGWGSVTAPAGKWMDITFTNFPTGTVSWVCVEEGHGYGPYSTTLTSGTETLTSHTCYDTESGGSDYVTADGISSNTIGTD